MNRKELIAAVHAGTDGLRGRAAANASVAIIIKTIAAALAAGEDIEINSFGKFVHVNGRRHVGRNFKTGETIEISARRSVIFRPAPLPACETWRRRETRRDDQRKRGEKALRNNL
jgi:nucleoid DNA-binding protein